MYPNTFWFILYFRVGVERDIVHVSVIWSRFFIFSPLLLPCCLFIIVYLLITIKKKCYFCIKIKVYDCCLHTKVKLNTSIKYGSGGDVQRQQQHRSIPNTLHMVQQP